MLFNIAVCDDEELFLEKVCERIKTIMAKYKYEFAIFDFNNSEEFIIYCKKNPIDIIFLDIDMPDKDGFIAVNELQKQQPDIAVIFVSIHEELAYQSFSYNPYQFISKRHLDRLEGVLTDLVLKIKYQKEQETIIHIKSGENIINVNTEQIMYLQSNRNYIIAYDENENAVLKFRAKIKDIYDELSKFGFIYTHKCYICNCRFIQKFERKKVILSNNKEIKGTRKAEVIDEAQRLYGNFMRKSRW